MVQSRGLFNPPVQSGGKTDSFWKAISFSDNQSEEEERGGGSRERRCARRNISIEAELQTGRGEATEEAFHRLGPKAQSNRDSRLAMRRISMQRLCSAVMANSCGGHAESPAFHNRIPHRRPSICMVCMGHGLGRLVVWWEASYLPKWYPRRGSRRRRKRRQSSTPFPVVVKVVSGPLGPVGAYLAL